MIAFWLETASHSLEWSVDGLENRRRSRETTRAEVLTMALRVETSNRAFETVR
jgi:hypothetical protein